MEVCVSRASAVIVQRVPATAVDWFVKWQRGITHAAEGFPGYQATDFYPPTVRQQHEWVIVIHFDNPEALQRWLDSPVRSEWTAKLPGELKRFGLKTLPGGFGPWFASLVQGAEGGVPPSWKMVLTVLLGLYPTVMMLTLFVGPYTAPLGPAVSMLIGNALSVSILQWAVMPVLNPVLGPWLRARGDRGRLVSAVGLVLVSLLLAGMSALFRQITG